MHDFRQGDEIASKTKATPAILLSLDPIEVRPFFRYQDIGAGEGVNIKLDSLEELDAKFEFVASRASEIIEFESAPANMTPVEISEPDHFTSAIPEIESFSRKKDETTLNWFQLLLLWIKLKLGL